jgi:hypothetical protein
LSAIDDLIAQVQEPRLREQLKREWAEAQKTKKFGLVFDRHLPELVPISKGRSHRGQGRSTTMPSYEAGLRSIEEIAKRRRQRGYRSVETA